MEYRSECEEAGKQVRPTVHIYFTTLTFLCVAGSTHTTPFAGCYGQNLSECIFCSLEFPNAYNISQYACICKRTPVLVDCKKCLLVKHMHIPVSEYLIFV